MVHFSLVQDTTREAHYLPARLAWQSPSAGGALLVLRRLLCAPRSSGRSEGGPVRTVHKRSVHQTQHESDGTVFGCTLGNLMQHCRHTKNKYPLASSMGVLRRVLTGVSNTVGCSTGDDVETLVMGLGCHRVVKSQASRLPELKKWASRPAPSPPPRLPPRPPHLPTPVVETTGANTCAPATATKRRCWGPRCPC